MINKMVSFTFAISLLAVAVACGDGAAKEEAVPDGPAKAFYGVWDGQYQTLDRKDGHTLSESVARAEFIPETETAGTFRMRFPIDEDATVAGTFQVFRNDSLLLEITESNFSGIGLTGTVTSVDFEVAGNALSLENDRLKLLLIRDGEGVFEEDGSSPDGGETEEPLPVSGRWDCNDSIGAKWNLRINTSDFSATVVNGSGASYDVSGKVEELQQASEALLTITNSNLSINVGRTLRVAVAGNVLTVALSSTSAQIDSFVCNRK